MISIIVLHRVQGFVFKSISQSSSLPGAVNILTVSLTFNLPVTSSTGISPALGLNCNDVCVKLRMLCMVRLQ
jgi:hypothetical protein